MNLRELYERTPTQHHNRIVVMNNEVTVLLPQRILTFLLLNACTDEERLTLKSNCELTTGIVDSLQELGLYP